MGWIRMPANVRLDDVADVIGRMLGQEGRIEEIGSGAIAARVDGVKTSAIAGMPQCARIDIGTHATFTYHFEAPRGRRLIQIAADTREGLALGRGLVEFFGGVFEDEFGEVLLRGEDRTDAENHPDDGTAWNDLQHRIVAVQPIRKKRSKR